MYAERSKYDSINPNSIFADNKGFWAYYVLIIVAAHLLLLSVPFISTEVVWTLTNMLHTAITFLGFHWLKGAPFATMDQGDAFKLTQWEQLDSDDSMTMTKKLLIAAPVVIFMLATSYTHHNGIHFAINLICLGLALVPKLPQLRGVRLFGINKY